MSLSLVIIDADQIPAFPMLKNLKQMKLLFGQDFDEGLELFFRLFKASPLLGRLLLDLGTSPCPAIKHGFTDGCSKHGCLEELEMDDFSKCDNKVQLLMYIAHISPLLEKITIRPRLQKVWRCNGKENIDIKEDDFERVVQNIQSRLAQIKLVILKGSLPKYSLEY